jgi:hypothetical protein
VEKEGGGGVGDALVSVDEGMFLAERLQQGSGLFEKSRVEGTSFERGMGSGHGGEEGPLVAQTAGAAERPADPVMGQEHGRGSQVGRAH